MRFLAGVVVGIVIGRPVLNVVNDHLTPPVKKKIFDAAWYVNDRTYRYLCNKIPQVDRNEKNR